MRAPAELGLTEEQRRAMLEQIELEESLELERKRFDRAFNQVWKNRRATNAERNKDVRETLGRLTFGRDAKRRKSSAGISPMRGISKSDFGRVFDV